MYFSIPLNARQSRRTPVRRWRCPDTSCQDRHRQSRIASAIVKRVFFIHAYVLDGKSFFIYIGVWIWLHLHRLFQHRVGPFILALEEEGGCGGGHVVERKAKCIIARIRSLRQLVFHIADRVALRLVVVRHAEALVLWVVVEHARLVVGVLLAVVFVIRCRLDVTGGVAQVEDARAVFIDPKFVDVHFLIHLVRERGVRRQRIDRHGLRFLHIEDASRHHQACQTQGCPKDFLHKQ